MRPSTLALKSLLVLAAAMSATALLRADDTQTVAFPEGYRSWTHVKSIVIEQPHPLFAQRGGIHHYYANDLAVEGYRTGKFPDGAIVVDEAVIAHQGEGPAAGIVTEGGRRFLDVMTKNEARYPQTGGWGFQHFDKEETKGGLTSGEQSQCYGCHSKAKERDHVFSQIRP
jgi:Cytochrome P460